MPRVARAADPAAVRAAVDHALIHQAEAGSKITLEQGDTVFLELKKPVPANRLRLRPSDYEGQIADVKASSGIVVPRHIDEVRFEPAGDHTAIVFHIAVSAEPRATPGPARADLTLKLVERTGLGNLIVSIKSTNALTVVKAQPTESTLALDFVGYRLYAGIAQERLDQLQKGGVTGLSLADEGPLPTLDRFATRTVLAVLDFDRNRRRMWIARHRLLAAQESKDQSIATLARTYLANLDKSDSELTGAPATAVANGGVVAGPSATAETLKPVRVEPGPSGPAPKGTIAPSGSYEAGSEGDELDEPVDAPRPKPPAPATEAAKTPVKPETQPSGGGEARGGDRSNVGAEASAEQEFQREKTLPTYPRALVLDDPNVGYGAGVRFEWATVKRIEGTTGIAPALFFEAQAALTRNFGLELQVPTSLVSIDVQRAQSTYAIGNPLIAAKYRFHLPEIEGRNPVLTIRARWAIPMQPLHSVPPTQFGAEEFSQPAHFADTSAFLLEKSAIGFGASAAYQIGMIYMGAQLYSDYYIPVQNAENQEAFLTVSYGASVGAFPFGSIVGFYAEGRATSLFAGPGRTELFAYLGARGHLLNFIEPAAWICLPIGSVSDVTGVQLGAGLHFTYDLQDAIVFGRAPASRDFQ